MLTLMLQSALHKYVKPGLPKTFRSKFWLTAV